MSGVRKMIETLSSQKNKHLSADAHYFCRLILAILNIDNLNKL